MPVTSAGPGGVGGIEPSQTVDIEAILQGKAVVPPPHRTQNMALSNVPRQNDPGASPFVASGWLAGWLAGVASVSAPARWPWSR